MMIKRWWYIFWIRMGYWCRLRWPAIWWQRRVKGEHKAARKPVMTFETPTELVRYAMARFEYRRDQGRIGGWVFPLDWTTDPEVFQARLDDGVSRDGDCDDYHFWAATALLKIDGVERVYLLLTGYGGGGHATVVYAYRGAWFHLDYRIYAISSPNKAPQQVAERYGDGDILFWVFETVEPPWQPVAIYPRRLKI